MSAVLLVGVAGELHADIVGTRTIPRLDELARTVWRGVHEGYLTDAEAEALQGDIDARRATLSVPRHAAPVISAAASGLRRMVSLFKPRRRQAPPDRQEAIRRRRMLAGSGALPSTLRGLFTEGQRSVLTIVASEVKVHRRCVMPLDKIAALAGVGRTTVKNALDEALRLGLLTVALRPQRRAKNLPNLIEIVSQEWLTWIKRGPKHSDQHLDGIGSKTPASSKILSPTKNLTNKIYHSEEVVQVGMDRQNAHCPPHASGKADRRGDGGHHRRTPWSSPGVAGIAQVLRERAEEASRPSTPPAGWDDVAMLRWAHDGDSFWKCT